MQRTITLNSKLYVALIILPLISGAPAVSQTKKKLTEAEAIQAAEKFIADNGYTDLPPIADKTKLAYESVEWASDSDELLKQRHNTLERKAYGLRNNGRLMKPGLTIVFRRTDKCRDCKIEFGRWVTMDPYGRNMRVEHKDFPLVNVTRKL